MYYNIAIFKYLVFSLFIMGLLKLLGLKPSAKRVAGVIAEELEKVLHFYGRQNLSNLRKLDSYIYYLPTSKAAPFQFYYDGQKLEILPLVGDCLTEPLNDRRNAFVSAIKQKLGIEQVELSLFSD